MFQSVEATIVGFSIATSTSEEVSRNVESPLQALTAERRRFAPAASPSSPSDVTRSSSAARPCPASPSGVDQSTETCPAHVGPRFRPSVGEALDSALLAFQARGRPRFSRSLSVERVSAFGVKEAPRFCSWDRTPFGTRTESVCSSVRRPERDWTACRRTLDVHECARLCSSRTEREKLVYLQSVLVSGATPGMTLARALKGPERRPPWAATMREGRDTTP